MIDTIVETKTADTYEASFYLLYGANIVDVRQRPIQQSKAKRKGYNMEYVIHLNDVPQWAKDSWRTGQCYVNIHDFVAIRKALKRRMKRV